MIQIFYGLPRILEITLLPKDMHEDGVDNLCSIQWSNEQLVAEIRSSPCFFRMLINDKHGDEETAVGVDFQ
jgi:hypothetical protein